MRSIKYILLFSLALGWAASYAQPTPLTFEHYNDDEGLLSNSVNDLAKDRSGYLWLATSRGLHRFDGYRFKVYLNDRDDPNSLPDSYTSAVFADNQDRIWVGTKESGVALLDRDKGTFESFYNEEGTASKISHNQVTGIGQLSDGTIVVATAGGYNLFDESTRTFTIHRSTGGIGLADTDPARRAQNLSEALQQVGIPPGSSPNFAPSSRTPAPATAPNQSTAEKKIANRAGRTALEKLDYWADFLYYDSRQAYASLSELLGAERADKLWPSLETLLEEEKPEETGRNAYADISSLHIDESDNIFLGYKHGGVGMVSPGASVPEILHLNLNHYYLLQYKQVNGMLRDQDTLYLGVLQSGVKAINLKTGREMVPNVDNQSVSVYKIARKGKDIYFATTAGLLVYDRETGTTATHDNHEQLGWTMVASECSSVLPDENGVVWVGHFSHGLSKAAPRQAFYSHRGPGKTRCLDSCAPQARCTRIVKEDCG